MGAALVAPRGLKDREQAAGGVLAEGEARAFSAASDADGCGPVAVAGDYEPLPVSPFGHVGPHAAFPYRRDLGLCFCDLLFHPGLLVYICLQYLCKHLYTPVSNVGVLSCAYDMC